MSAQNWLNDVTKAFQEKLKTTDKILPSTWAQLIRENWASGGSGGKRATIKSPSKGWVGTTVPRTGLIENVYVNTELSYEEVVAILEQLTYTESNGNMAPYFIMTSGENGDIGVAIMKQGDMILLLAMTEGVTSELDALIFACNVPEEMTSQMGVVNGWNISINNNLPNPIPFNVEAVETHPVLGLPSGAENELLNSLLSITPFVKEMGEEIVLEGEYDGSTYIFDGKGGAATPVPNSGTLQDVYFNTALTPEEVCAEIAKITINGLYPIIWDAEPSDSDPAEAKNMVCIEPAGSNGYIIHWNAQCLFAYYDGSAEIDVYGFSGWNPELFTDTNKMSFDNEITLSNGDSSGEFQCGDQNDKLINLISTTPFGGGSSDTINIKELIEQKKIPLEIKVNVEAGGNARVIIAGTGETKPTLPVEGYDKSIYFNTRLTENEVNDILSAIEFEGSSNEYIVCYFEEGSSTYKLSVTRYWYNDKPVHSIVYGSGDIFTSYTGGSGSSGWSTWMSNPITGNLIQPGSQNDKIVNIFSGTPFSYEVPGDGSLVDIYVNTALSVEEVDAILDTIEIGGSSDSYTAYYIEYGSDGLRLCVRKGYPGWIIDNEIMGERLYDSTGGSGASFHGWNPNFDGVIEILEFKESDPGMVYGVSIYDNQNDKLANLFSIAPFGASEDVEAINLSGDYDGSQIEVIENGSVDIKKLIENNRKLPLAIDVNVDNPVIVNGEYESIKLNGEYDGSTIEITKNSLVNIKSLIEEDNKLPLAINFNGFSLQKLIELRDGYADYLFRSTGYKSDLTDEMLADLDITSCDIYSSMNECFRGCKNLRYPPLISVRDHANTYRAFMSSGVIKVEFLHNPFYSPEFAPDQNTDEMFSNCSSLKSIVIRYEYNSYFDYDSDPTPALKDSYYSRGDTYIYISRKALNYLQNSSSYDNTWWKKNILHVRAVEDYTVDGTLTGEFDLSKI